MIDPATSPREADYAVGILSTFDCPTLPLLIDAILARGIDSLCVILDRKGFGVRNHEIWRERTGGALEEVEPQLGDFAHKKIPFFFVESHNAESCLKLVESLRIRLLVNGGTPRKLARPLRMAATQGVLNVHPGVLPKYRGSSCVEWALYNGDPIGNTAHFMSDEYDEGPVIRGDVYKFRKTSSYRDIRKAVYRGAITLAAEVIEDVLKLELTADLLPPQGQGTQYPTIPADKMEEVLARVSAGMHPSMVL